MSDSNNVATLMSALALENPGTPEHQTYVFPCRKYTCEITWKIPNFNLYENATLESCPFSPEDSNHEWLLKLHSGSRINSVSPICLILESGKNVVKKFGPASGIVQFAIFNSEGEKSHYHEENFNSSKETRRYNVLDGETLRHELITRADLFDPKNESLLPEGNLSIYCHVSFVLLDEAKSDRIQDYRKYLSDEVPSDLTINVGGKNYAAHKSALAAHSPVFRAMFEHDTMENQQNTVIIKDIDEPTFVEMLRYIYIGKVENLKASAFELLLVADKYNIQRLRTICEMEIEETLSKETALEILIFADQYNFEKLKAEAIEYITENLTEMMRSECWNEINSHPNLLGDLLKAQIEKYDQLVMHTENRWN